MADQKSKGPSLHPQRAKNGIWYYEEKGRIRIYVDATRVRECAQKQMGMNFTLPRHMLKKSLERMR